MKMWGEGERERGRKRRGVTSGPVKVRATERLCTLFGTVCCHDNTLSRAAESTMYMYVYIHTKVYAHFFAISIFGGSVYRSSALLTCGGRTVNESVQDKYESICRAELLIVIQDLKYEITAT